MLCRTETKNFVISPTSLAILLALVSAGLKGECRRELRRFLAGGIDLPAEDPEQEEIFHKVCNIKLAHHQPWKMGFKLLVDKDCEVREGADVLLKTSIERVDFAKDTENIRKYANTWVAMMTEGKVPNFLPESSIKTNSGLVLLNAMHFKGVWCEEFKPLRERMDFTLRNGEKVKREFMRNVSSIYRYVETDSIRLVMIPYKEIEDTVYTFSMGFDMCVIIPKDDRKPINEVMGELTQSSLIGMIKSMPKAGTFEVDLTMPKFRIEYGIDNLPGHLGDYGLRKMFTPGQCDLSGFFSKSKKDLYVENLISRTVVEVNEKQTEAAGADVAVNLVGRSLKGPPLKATVTVDRPFFFGIIGRITSSGWALVGICSDP